MKTLSAIKTNYYFTHSCFRGWAFVVVLFCMVCSTIQAKDKPSRKDQSNAVLELLDKGEKFMKEGGQIAAADSCFSKALEIAKSLQDQSLQQRAEYGKCTIMYQEGNYDSAVQTLDSILHSVPKDQPLFKAKVAKLLGNNLVYLGEYAKAYEHQLNALEYYKSQKDKENVAMISFSIGNNFFYQEQLKLALKEFEKSKELWQEIENEQGVFWALGAMASVHEHLGNLDLAIKYSEESLVIAKRLDSDSDIAWTFFIIGSISASAGDLEKSLTNLSSAKSIAEKMGDMPLLGYILQSATATHMRKRNFHTALKTLDESFEIAQSNNDKATIPGLYKLYSDIYFELKQYRKAREYIQRYVALKDSLQSEEMTANMGSLKKDFEVREVERQNEIELLKKDTKLKSFRILIWVGAFVLAFIMSIFLVILINIRNRHAKEKNDILVANNLKILKQNKKLRSSNRDLKQYAYIISHDLKEPLRNIGSFSSLLKRRLGKNAEEEVQDYINYITGGVAQMHSLLNDLSEYSKIKNKTKGEIEIIDARVVIDQVLDSIAYQIESTNATINISAIPKIYMGQNQFFQIILNLVSNAIKFCKDRDPVIDISCKLVKKEFIFSIKDNGIGIDKEFHDKIFVVFQRLHHRGEYSGSGIGLSTCKKIINAYGGEIWLNSEKGKGTNFFFSVPMIPDNSEDAEDVEVIDQNAATAEMAY